MKCSDFELNISAFIDGELKQTIYSLFKEHKNSCSNCNQKYNDIYSIVNGMSQINAVMPSNKFINNETATNTYAIFWDYLWAGL